MIDAVEAAIDEGNLHFDSGRLERAVAEWAHADRLLEAQPGRSLDRLAVLARLAESNQALGRYEAAARNLRESLDIARASGQARILAETEGTFGRVLYLMGETASSRRHLDACLRYAQGAGDRRLRATTLNDLGNLLAATDPAASLSAHREAFRIARDAGHQALAATAGLNEARTLLDSGDDAASERVLLKALDAFSSLTDSRHKAEGLLGAGRLLTRIENLWPDASHARDKRINAAFELAAGVARSVNHHQVLALALGYRGELYESRARYIEAMRLTRQALFETASNGLTELEYRWHWQLARLHEARGDSQLALNAYREAANALQSLRRETLGAPWQARQALHRDAGTVFLALAEALLAQAGRDASQSTAQALLREARETVELSKSVELEDYFQDDCVAALQAKAAAVDELSDRAAALYPIVLANRVELLVSFSDRMVHVTSPMAKSEVIENLNVFRNLLAKRTLQYRRPATKLYDALLRPIEAHLQAAGIDTLVFIPGGALRTIPIAALYDGEKHLIEKYSIALAPGLTLLDPRPLSRTNVEPLIGGVSEGVQGFAPLPHVAAELQAVKNILGGEVYADAGFVTANVQRALDLRPFTLVHLASHARFAASAKDSFLLTYDGRMDMDELERFIKRSRFRKEPVELLTLSACDTAVGDEQAALGLAGIAVKAGARSVLASLWLINDEAASELISAFYLQLGRGVSKATALQAAQLRMLNDQRYRFPVYWAPFLLIGNWL